MSKRPSATPRAMDEHYEKLAQMYLSAPVNQAFAGLQMEVREGASTVSMEVRPDLHHAAGAMHGSHYFKLLDDAAFFACNSLVRDVFVLTASFHIELFRPVVAGRIRAEGTVSKPGRTILFASAELFDERGAVLAKGSGTFARSKVPLDAVPTYALATANRTD